MFLASVTSADAAGAFARKRFSGQSFRRLGRAWPILTSSLARIELKQANNKSARDW